MEILQARCHHLQVDGSLLAFNSRPCASESNTDSNLICDLVEFDLNGYSELLVNLPLLEFDPLELEFVPCYEPNAKLGAPVAFEFIDQFSLRKVLTGRILTPCIHFFLCCR